MRWLRLPFCDRMRQGIAHPHGPRYAAMQVRTVYAPPLAGGAPMVKLVDTADLKAPMSSSFSGTGFGRKA